MLTHHCQLSVGLKNADRSVFAENKNRGRRPGKCVSKLFVVPPNVKVITWQRLFPEALYLFSQNQIQKVEVRGPVKLQLHLRSLDERSISKIIFRVSLSFAVIIAAIFPCCYLNKSRML